MLRKLTFFLFTCIFGFLYAQNERNLEDFAVLIIGYKRPDYLKTTLQALAENPESKEIPIYFFFDGGSNAKQEENVRVANSFQFPNAHFYLRERNFGCPKNIIDARRTLLDELGYEKVLVIEDDNVITPNYIKFILNLYEWAKDNIPNVGVVSGGSRCLLSKEEKQARLNQVISTRAHLWAYLLDRNCWDLVKDTYYEYENLFLKEFGNVYYKYKTQIRKWIRRKVINNPNFHRRDKSSAYFCDLNLLSFDYPVGQDGIMNLAFWENQLLHITSVVNRVYNVGKEGLNCNEEIWNKFFKNVTFDLFSEDEFISEFKLID